MSKETAAEKRKEEGRKVEEEREREEWEHVVEREYESADFVKRREEDVCIKKQEYSETRDQESAQRKGEEAEGKFSGEEVVNKDKEKEEEKNNREKRSRETQKEEEKGNKDKNSSNEKANNRLEENYWHSKYSWLATRESTRTPILSSPLFSSPLLSPLLHDYSLTTSLYILIFIHNRKLGAREMYCAPTGWSLWLCLCHSLWSVTIYITHFSLSTRSNTPHLHTHIHISAPTYTSGTHIHTYTTTTLTYLYKYTHLHTCLYTDDRHIVSSSEDRSIKIWDIYNGKCVRSLYGHQQTGL